MYQLRFDDEATEGIARLKKSEPAAFKKLVKLLSELQEHPKTGTGKPKPLGGNRAGQWSRHISDKHRLVYTIDEDEVVSIVEVLSVWGHYGDK